MAGMICVAEVSAPEAFYEKGNTFFTGLLNLGAANYSWNPVFGCQLWLKNVAVEVYQICSETSRLRGSLFHPMTSLGEINGAQSHGLGTVQRKTRRMFDEFGSKTPVMQKTFRSKTRCVCRFTRQLRNPLCYVWD